MSAKCTKFIELARQFRVVPSLIFDIGAFDGNQTIELSDAFPAARLVCVEADPSNFVRLWPKVCARANVTALSAALDVSADGLTWFHQAAGANAECGSLLLPNGAYPEPMPSKAIMVPAVSSFTLTSRFGTPDLLWMDIQGSELNFFPEVSPRLPMLVWMEVAYQAYYFGQLLDKEIHARMRALGYNKVWEERSNNWFGDCCYTRV